jgi:nucleoid-associated protein YgaU
VKRRPSRRATADDEDAAPAGTGEARTYTIEKGDTLAGISKKFYGTTKHWGAIQKHNNIKDVKTIKPGMVLELPAR